MTLDPWTVYFVMQADSILELLCGISLFSGFFSAISIAISVFCFLEVSKKAGFRSSTIAVTLFLLSAGSGIACGLFPTTKTAAAVLLIPAIANNETIQDEASEIYQIAKDALREIGKDSEED